jgi:hypothetical protein
MDLDTQLSQAFAAWSAARDVLAQQRRRLAGGGQGGQLAASPEAAGLVAEIAAQEQTCQALFAELVAIAERRAEALENERRERTPRDRQPPKQG